MPTAARPIILVLVCQLGLVLRADAQSVAPRHADDEWPLEAPAGRGAAASEPARFPAERAAAARPLAAWPVRLQPARPRSQRTIKLTGGASDQQGSSPRRKSGRGEQAIPLAPESHGDQAATHGLGMPSLGNMLASLAAVLGLFLFLTWLLRRGMPRGSLPLPGEVFEVLGKAPLVGRQQVHLARVGGKLLLISMSPSGTETLTEITDPREVERLTALCDQSLPSRRRGDFRRALAPYRQEPATLGIVGESRAERREPARFGGMASQTNAREESDV